MTGKWGDVQEEKMKMKEDDSREKKKKEGLKEKKKEEEERLNGMLGDRKTEPALRCQLNPQIHST